jgi:hypothetical protein
VRQKVGALLMFQDEAWIEEGDSVVTDIQQWKNVGYIEYVVGDKRLATFS